MFVEETAFNGPSTLGKQTNLPISRSLAYHICKVPLPRKVTYTQVLRIRTWTTSKGHSVYHSPTESGLLNISHTHGASRKGRTMLTITGKSDLSPPLHHEPKRQAFSKIHFRLLICSENCCCPPWPTEPIPLAVCMPLTGDGHTFGQQS